MNSSNQANQMNHALGNAMTATIPSEDDLTNDELTQQEINARIRAIKLKIRKLQRKKLAKQRQSPEARKEQKPQHPDQSRKKKQSRAHDAILKSMIKLVDDRHAKGFVYGVVLSNGKTVTGSSTNLRSWWKKTIRFDRNAPLLVLRNSPSGTAQMPDISVPRTLLEIQDSTLGSLLSALMQHCEPPQRKFPIHNGTAPPWWPTVVPEWWAELGIPRDGEVPPYRKPHNLRKAWKACVLISVIRHLAPKFSRMKYWAMQSKSLHEKMSAREIWLWDTVIDQERRNYGADESDESDESVVLQDEVMNDMNDEEILGNASSVCGRPECPNRCLEVVKMENYINGTEYREDEVMTDTNGGETLGNVGSVCGHRECPHSGLKAVKMESYRKGMECHKNLKKISSISEPDISVILQDEVMTDSKGQEKHGNAGLVHGAPECPNRHLGAVKTENYENGMEGLENLKKMSTIVVNSALQNGGLVRPNLPNISETFVVDVQPNQLKVRMCPECPNLRLKAIKMENYEEATGCRENLKKIPSIEADSALQNGKHISLNQLNISKNAVDVQTDKLKSRICSSRTREAMPVPSYVVLGEHKEESIHGNAKTIEVVKKEEMVSYSYSCTEVFSYSSVGGCLYDGSYVVDEQLEVFQFEWSMLDERAFGVPVETCMYTTSLSDIPIEESTDVLSGGFKDV